MIKGVEQKELLESKYQAARCVWDRYGKHILSDAVQHDFYNALNCYEKLLNKDCQ